MKILHLISGGDTGGAKTHLLTLLSAMVKDGIEAELLCVMEGAFTQEAEKLNIPIKIIYQKNRCDFAAIKKIKEYINSGNYELVHCHGARANYIAMFIKNALKIPMLTTLHSDYKLDFKGNKYKHLIFTPINAIALRKFNYILTVTNSFRDMLISRGFDERKMYTIYNGINFEKECIFEDKEKFLQRYGLKYEEDKIYIGIAARLFAVKGVKYFLEGAKLIYEENKNIVFLIAGNGEEESDLKAYAKENNMQERVHFLGFVKDIESFYNVLDINTLTSLSESFPYSLLEGAKMRKATIATAVGGIVEMIDDNENGLLFEVENSKELAKKMLMLAEDKSLREKLGNNFYEKAKECFSDKKMLETHKEIYKKILEKEKAK